MYGHRDRIREKDDESKKKDDYEDKSGLYVPLGNHNAEFGNLKRKLLLLKLVKGIES